MAKRKKASKVQKRAKLRRGSSAKRGKARKIAKAAPRTKPTVAKAKPKPAPVKKIARKVKRPVTPVVETVAVEVIEQPAPGVITVTEIEETRKASWTGLLTALTALGREQTMFRLRDDTKHSTSSCTFKARRVGGPFFVPQALWASRNSLMRPRTEPDNAQNQRREYCDIHHCINHASLHWKADCRYIDLS
jgi:hypothetical protein